MLSYKGNLITNFVRLILKQDVHRIPFFMGDAFLELCTVRSSISIGFDDHFKFPTLLIGTGIVGVDPGFQKVPLNKSHTVRSGEQGGQRISSLREIKTKIASPKTEGIRLI